MARNNYSFEKRRREIDKKKKKEQKRLKKLSARGIDEEADDAEGATEETNQPTGQEETAGPERD